MGFQPFLLLNIRYATLLRVREKKSKVCPCYHYAYAMMLVLDKGIYLAENSANYKRAMKCALLNTANEVSIEAVST